MWVCSPDPQRDGTWFLGFGPDPQRDGTWFLGFGPGSQTELRERERERGQVRELARRSSGKIGSCGRRESMIWSFFPALSSSSFLVFQAPKTDAIFTLQERD